jgi:H/ACA ribonucleoprotein complex subunit 2
MFSICILAADVSPVDVFSHIPISCEKRDVPYVFVASREALGTASQTKRPTSVVMLLTPPADSKYSEQFNKLAEVIKLLNPYLKK